MALWKVELYEKATDSTPIRWGVMVAASEDQARDTMIANMGSEDRADAKTVRVSEITSLPEGTFFWKAGDA